MDSDSDVVGNMCDEDDDNDCILDVIEAPNTNTILWVNSNGVATTEEQNTIDKQTALGYTVTVVDDNVGGNVDNHAVTFIYEDVNSGTAFTNVSNPVTTERGVITSENALHDKILGGLTGGTNVTHNINITNNTHPITDG